MRARPLRLPAPPLASSVVVFGVAGLVVGVVAGLVAGCTHDVPAVDIRVVDDQSTVCAVPSVEDKITGLLGPGDALRVSVRLHNPDGSVPATGAICDTLLTDPRQPFQLKLPVGGTFDLYAEAFTSDQAGRMSRVASGAQLGLVFAAADTGDKVNPTLRLYHVQTFQCLPGTPLSKQRAFHTATLLPNGDVLLIGGLRVNADETMETLPADADESYFVTGSIEVYDTKNARFLPVAGALAQPRAFHHVALLNKGAESGGAYQLAVLGGVATTVVGMPVVQSAGVTVSLPVPQGFRFTPTSNSAAAGPEILLYDPVAHSVKAGPMATPALQAQSAAWEAAAPLAQGGLVFAGGVTQPGPSAAPQTAVGTTLDGTSETSMPLPAARAGAALATIPTAAGAATETAFLIGGAVAPPPMMGAAESPFLTVDVASLALAQPMASSTLPAYFLPTVTLLDTDPAASSWRFLISGGLEIEASAALQPPARTLQVVTYEPATDPLPVAEVQGSADVPVLDTCTPMVSPDNRYRPTAFNAATLIAPADPQVSPDRVLVTGGTPRDPPTGCVDCQNGDDSLACVVGQASLVSVPPPSATPNAGVVSSAGALLVPRFGHTQTQLADGNVLVAGGFTRHGAGGAGPVPDGGVQGTQSTYGVLAAELWNPARMTPPTMATTRATPPVAVPDPDDPLSADLRAANLVRALGATAHAPGATAPAIPCVGLGK